MEVLVKGGIITALTICECGHHFQAVYDLADATSADDLHAVNACPECGTEYNCTLRHEWSMKAYDEYLQAGVFEDQIVKIIT